MWRTFITNLKPEERWCARHCEYGHSTEDCPLAAGTAPHDQCDHAGNVCEVTS